VGRLPAPRSDLTSVTLGSRAYLVGGYDGKNLAPDVLETPDGRRFHAVTKIPVPVRYAAVAGLGGRLFVFGGQTGSGETSAIQEVNINAGRGRIAGRLPVRLSHAGAVVLGGFVYVIGGRTNGVASRRIWSFDPASGRVRRAGLLPMALSDFGVATLGKTGYVIGGEGNSGPTTAVISLRIATGSEVGFGMSEYPFNGRLLIADRGNNRLLLVDPKGKVLWTYPSSRAAASSGGFYYPDDAFFAGRGRSVIVNEEGNHVVVRIAFPSGRLLWRYGHPGVFGSARGYLHEPDDAYLLKNGQVVVADNQNCRVVFINPAGKIVSQIGSIGLCLHQPPRGLGSPNGDTPLANGDVLISEINGSWISEYTRRGHLVWTVQLPLAYPSDPQQIGPDRYLVADYATPGGLYEFSRSGQILWRYVVTNGPGMLNHPSLAERLPNAFIAVTDDYRHRIVVINPVTQSIVWQYGQTDLLGVGKGLLNTPDGFDLLAPDGSTPTHAATG
jgi:Kelch motif/PQQ-like domain